jgi:uncharacterized protein YegL
MVGEPQDIVNQGIRQLTADLISDPTAIETVWISVICFSSRAVQVVPLTEVTMFTPPPLPIGPGTGLGAAFDLLGKCIAGEVRQSTSTQRGDWKPIVYMLTDGVPTDNWQESLRRFRAAFPSITTVAVGCGEDVDMAILKNITPNVLLMKNISPDAMKSFFKWVSRSVCRMSRGVEPDGKPDLPVLPGAALAAQEAKSSGLQSQVILAVRCRDTRKGYLIRYRADPSRAGTFHAEKAYRVGDDYFSEAAAGPSGQAYDSSRLQGFAPCPYCGRKGWATARGAAYLECSDTTSAGGRAQVMFVLDVTGSMAGEIAGVKDNIRDFVDFIDREGTSVEVGLIAFRDLKVAQRPELLSFNGKVFTRDVDAFQGAVARLRARGGGTNGAESSLAALVQAAGQPFAEDAARVIILITDERPWIPDENVETVQDVHAALRKARVNQLHIVIPERLNKYYQPLLEEVKGKIYRLEPDGRGGVAFKTLITEIGRSITVIARQG